MSWRLDRARARTILLIVLVAAVAIEVRHEAVRKLPVDYDELVYLPAVYRYKDMMAAAQWGSILNYEENLEHPPLVKLLFATQLCCSGAPEPKWDQLEVGSPIPQPSRPSFFGTRAISAVGGVLQVLLMAIVSPLAGLLLALDTYHIKYSAQVYIEGIPGLMAVLAVFLLPSSASRGPYGSDRSGWHGPASACSSSCCGRRSGRNTSCWCCRRSPCAPGAASSRSWTGFAGSVHIVARVTTKFLNRNRTIV